MTNRTAIGLGIAVQGLLVLVANFVPLPAGFVWIGLVLAFTTGLAGGVVAGWFTDAVTATRAATGLKVGYVGGLVFGATLWLGMSQAIPRAEYSALWAANYLLATNPIGSDLAPWLYTGDTLLVPVVLLPSVLFAAEGYIAAGAVPRSIHSRGPGTE
jgi:hypothetical protein